MMGEFTLSRLRTKFLRRSSYASGAGSTQSTRSAATYSEHGQTQSDASLSSFADDRARPELRPLTSPRQKSKSASIPRRLRKHSKVNPGPLSPQITEIANPPTPSPSDHLSSAPPQAEVNTTTSSSPQISLQEPTPDEFNSKKLLNGIVAIPEPPPLDPDPDLDLQTEPAAAPPSSSPTSPLLLLPPPPPPPDEPSREQLSSQEPSKSTSSVPRPDLTPRKQSLVPHSQQLLVQTLLQSENPVSRQTDIDIDYSNDTQSYGLPAIYPQMIHRRVWVKRPGASATIVTVNEDDLVDDVRDVILRKYGNTLGRNFDSPDLTLRIVARETPSRQGRRDSRSERLLGPEEPIGRTLDAYFPGGQTVDEALLIDIPARRTPRPSPRQIMPSYHPEDIRPGEGGEYFPPMPAAVPTPPHMPSNTVSAGGPPAGASHPHHQPTHSLSVLTTGQLPPLPSPGGRSARHRPKYLRQHTASPVITLPSQNVSDVSNTMNGVAAAPPAPAPMPTPPIPGSLEHSHKPVLTPPARTASPRPQTKPRKTKKMGNSNKSQPGPKALPAGLLDGSVPPINVLIVEDNVINLRLLEAFMKRLHVRWQTAMNGREAVNKWRTGGFHLVLMDIQLPVMNGLDATKEIRRIERVNNIGVFSHMPASSDTTQTDLAIDAKKSPNEVSTEDKLENIQLFKSPVIIVALTASSLQSDRHEALAAGCNDFLTKPVNFVWLERKVTEWGCMQALIDFDGWRKWKDFSAAKDAKAASDAAKAKTNGTTAFLIIAVGSSLTFPRGDSSDSVSLPQTPARSAMAKGGSPASAARLKAAPVP